MKASLRCHIISFLILLYTSHNLRFLLNNHLLHLAKFNNLTIILSSNTQSVFRISPSFQKCLLQVVCLNEDPDEVYALYLVVQFSSVQLLSHVRLFVTP